MKRTIVFLALLAGLFVAACKTGPMTQSQFMFDCSFGQGSDHGCSGSSGCESFLAAASAQHKSQADCLAACEAEYRSKVGGLDCSSRVGKAYTLCQRYCRSNYQ